MLVILQIRSRPLVPRMAMIIYPAAHFLSLSFVVVIGFSLSNTEQRKTLRFDASSLLITVILKWSSIVVLRCSLSLSLADVSLIICHCPDRWEIACDANQLNTIVPYSICSARTFTFFIRRICPTVYVTKPCNNLNDATIRNHRYHKCPSYRSIRILARTVMLPISSCIRHRSRRPYQLRTNHRLISSIESISKIMHHKHWNKPLTMFYPRWNPKVN